MTMMKTAQINRYAILLVGVITFPLFCVAQLNVYAGAQNDNHCKLFYLVNPTDHFFYIAGLGPNDLANCQTFAIKSTSPASPIEINISNDYRHWLHTISVIKPLATRLAYPKSSLLLKNRD